jgi:carbon-monoxide dehydrogenase small subunit
LDNLPVYACQLLAMQVSGGSVVTIEGLAGEGPAGDGELDPVQRSFSDNDGGQCGYCTPGFVLTAKALLEHNPRPTGDEIRQALAGNLCRCNAYGRILRSVTELAGGPSPADTHEPCPSPASA